MKILVINPFGVGDVLFSTPLISALKKTYPRSYIGYICNIRTGEILETNPAIDEVFVFERDEYRGLWRRSKIECARKFLNFWSRVGKESFDIAVDLSLGKEYAFLCWLVGIKERRGFNYKGRGRFLTHRILFDGFNDKPVAEYYLDLADHKDKNRNKKTVLVPTDKDREYINNFLESSWIKEDDVIVGIAPGGGASFGKTNKEKRRWGADKFSKLADRIIERSNAKIVLIWGPGEEDLARNIASLMREKALLAPKTSIREMAALCKRCRVVICSEGGPLHIASSQGVKTISIFGAVDERVYGPYPPGEDNVVITQDIECRPCYRRFKLPQCDTRKCLESISVAEVFSAFEKLEGTRL